MHFGSVLIANITISRSKMIIAFLEEGIAIRIQVWGFEIIWDRFIILDVEGPLLGKDYVKESLRQVCIYQSDTEKWWDYINLFKSQCINSTQAEKCTNTLMELTKIDQNEVENCMKSSFQGTDEDIDDNDILRENFEKFKNEGIQNWPSILINKVLYKVRAFFKIVLLTISGHFRRKTSLRSNLQKLHISSSNLHKRDRGFKRDKN